MTNAFRYSKTSPEITRLVMRSLQKFGAAHAWSPQPFQPRPIPRPLAPLQGSQNRGPRHGASCWLLEPTCPEVRDRFALGCEHLHATCRQM